LKAPPTKTLRQATVYPDCRTCLFHGSPVAEHSANVAGEIAASSLVVAGHSLDATEDAEPVSVVGVAAGASEVSPFPVVAAECAVSVSVEAAVLAPVVGIAAESAVAA